MLYVLELVDKQRITLATGYIQNDQDRAPRCNALGHLVESEGSEDSGSSEIPPHPKYFSAYEGLATK